MRLGPYPDCAAPETPNANTSDEDEGNWFAHAQSLPGSLGMGIGDGHGGELSRMRSFFHDPDSSNRSTLRPEPVAVPDDADAIIRLEVLTAPEINWTLLSFYGATFAALVYVLVIAHLARASWDAEGVIRQSVLWETVVSALRMALHVAFVALPLLYALRLGTARRVASEQLWTACLLAAGLFCENPLTDVFYSLRTLLHSGDADGAALVLANVLPRGNKHHTARLILSDATYTVVIYVYIALSVHSYRILNSREYSRDFYLPKLLAAAAYFGIKIALGFGFRIALGLIPFSRLLLVFYLACAGRSSMRIVIPVLLTTVCDTYFVVWVMREVRKTAAFLARVPYLENRSKQLGFRCFVYQSLMLLSNLLLVSTVLDANMPRGVLYESYDASVFPRHSHRFIQLDPPVGQLALAFVYLTWNLIIAYVNLPPGPIMPYTVSALRNLVVTYLPTFITARHRWPAWMPGHFPREPESEAMNENDGGDNGGAEPSFHRRSNSTGELFDDHPALSLDGATAHALAERAEAAAASAAWRAGIPRGELCPLRYRHREFFEPLVEPIANVPPVHAYDLVAPLASSQVFWAAGPMHSAEMEAGLDDDDGETVDSPTSNGTPIPVPRGVEFDEHPDEGVESSAGDANLSQGASGRRFSGASLTGTSPGRPCMSLSQAFGPPPSSLPDSMPLRCRLLTRKNLFVLETQILLANAMYLCYIPGNHVEERPRDLNVSCPGPDLNSFADGLDKIVCDLEKERSSHSLPPPQEMSGPEFTLENDHGSFGSAKVGPVESMPNVDEPTRERDYDDGTFFQVDPSAIAAKNGFVLYRHIRHDESNGHAIILVGSDRVIVAFSGTRDAKNWMTNSRFTRVPWDVMFPHFEMEPSDTDPKDLAPSAHDLASSTQSSTPAGGPLKWTGSMFNMSGLSGLGGKMAESALDPASSTFHGMTERSTAETLGAMEMGASTVGSHLFSRDSERSESRSHLRRSFSDPKLPSSCERDCLIREHRNSDTHYGATSKPTRRDRGLPDERFAYQLPRNGSGRRLRPLRRPRRDVSEIEDVAQSLVQEFKTFGHAKVHLGFADAYSKLRKRVMGALEELYGGNRDGCGGSSDFSGGPSFERNVNGGVVGIERGSCRGLPLFFTGHSLGGVLATFASYEAARYCKRLGLRRRHDVACTTFGAPMSGNSVFKARYER